MRGELVAGWAKRALMVVVAAATACALLASTASANNPGVTHYPDLQTIIPLDSFSVVQGAAGKEFRYTHLVYNQGPGPLDIMPQYNQASGSYQGMQRLWTHNAAGTWQQVSQTQGRRPVHLPRAARALPLPARDVRPLRGNPDGSPGAPVALSPKNGFCISDSYSGYNSTVPHSGAFAGSWGECADPTTRRGLSVGSVDEYDYRDPGQAIPFDGVPDGTYWFRAMTDPNNDLVEGDESNNETDVKVTITGGTVSAGPGHASQHDATGDHDDRAQRRLHGQGHGDAVGRHGRERRRPVPRRRRAGRLRHAVLQPLLADLGLEHGRRRLALAVRAHDRRAGPDEHVLGRRRDRRQQRLPAAASAAPAGWRRARRGHRA